MLYRFFSPKVSLAANKGRHQEPVHSGPSGAGHRSCCDGKALGEKRVRW